ncbi:hypothetical protein [Janibacter anophelis]|uniref:hypothetical protein n=1 Tax=Janibacter anophelis TaxID=319054 RepID=UPI000DEEEC51|nr:hypothetical protein [Janibacter anophelis]
MTARTRRTALTTTGLAAALALALTGCVTPFDLGGDEPTSTTTPATPTSPSSTTTSPPDGAGRQLTQEEAEAALPPRPKGSTTLTVESTASERKTDPPECLDVLRIGEERDTLVEARVANATRGWAQRDPRLQWTHTVESYDRPAGSTLLDRAGAAMGGCSAFSLTGTDADGFFDLRVLAEPRAVSPLGEQSYAARLTTFRQVDGRSERIYLDYIVVRDGHNHIEVTRSQSDETAGFAPLEERAEEILRGLEEDPS